VKDANRRAYNGPLNATGKHDGSGRITLDKLAPVLIFSVQGMKRQPDLQN
jgi:hypothetical protein